TDDMVWQVDQVLRLSQLADVGDVLVIVAGMPPGTPGSTNSLRIHTIGDDVDYSIGGGI
ncbi:pyruvate kinase, partial [Gleimia europaea]|nr:pyruvate kinase [Gleimia europaea]